jgi:hypothetical protein
VRAVASLGLLACLLGACATPAEVRRDLVLKRSSREWGCPRESVKVRHLGSQVYEAKGCGERATYACMKSDPLLPEWDPDAWRCLLESRDGYRGPADRPAPPPPAPAQRKPMNDSMPGWSSGGEAPTAAPDSAEQSSAPSGSEPDQPKPE